jgi:transcriptional regulator with XRE-family HTH domain/anti-sigma regulatory factor (Ser/Thr protein kinase)
MDAEVIPLASRLRQRREELGLTQTQAAKQLDVARTAYRLWEMEAAKPAPDRWRTIAKWLGISMTAMLLAEELIDEQEALEANRAAAGGGMSSVEWDTQSDASAGDYFSQERAMIATQARAGKISDVDASNLGRVLARIQIATSSDAPSAWQPGEFRKRFPSDPIAPGLARAALATTAIGIPVDIFETAALLTSELVTNSVKHSGSDWIDVAITVGMDTLRVEVSDESTRTIRPRTSGPDGGLGLTIVAELASRWGIDRRSTGKSIWVELDLTPTP